MEKMLVAGSTGVLGSEICRLLRERDHEVRALARHSSNPDTIAQLESWGCEVVYGDLKKPETLASACEGVEAVISTVTSVRSARQEDTIEGVDQNGQINLVHAAAHAGVNQFILISFPDTTQYPNPLNDAKREVEKQMERSGMFFTSILANYFMEVWLSPVVGFDYTSGNLTGYGEDHRPISFVSYRDVAKLAVRCVGHPAARNQYIPFGGPQQLSYSDVAGIFEEVSRRKMNLTLVPRAGLLQQLSQISHPVESAFTCLMLNLCDGVPMNSQEVYESFAFEPTYVTDYAIKVVGTEA